MKTCCTLVVGKRRFERVDLDYAIREVRAVLQWRMFDRHVMALGSEVFPKQGKRGPKRD
jgi:hypothetical protein